MKRRYNKKSTLQTDIAKQRILELFEQAALRFKKQPEYSDRYVELARKIAMRYKVRFPKELKRKFCKHCHKYLVVGVNCRVRLSESKLVYSCLNCKKHMRYPYKPISRP